MDHSHARKSRERVSMKSPVMLESAAKLGSGYEFLLPLAPTIDRSFLESLIGNLPSIHLVPEALPALFHSRAGTIASGTATIEAAIMGTPFVMVYRVLLSPICWTAAHQGISLRHGQPDCRRTGCPRTSAAGFHAGKSVARMNEILPYGPARNKMTEGLANVSVVSGDQLRRRGIRLTVLLRWFSGFSTGDSQVG